VAKFRFSLEGVLKHRLHVEQEKQRALAVLQGQMTALKQELAGIEETVKQSTEDLRGHRLTGALDMGFLAAHRRFVLGMQSKAMEVVQKMARLQAQVEEAQRVLAEAAKQRKIMEKLKEKQFERWREELGRKELAALDEVGMQIARLSEVSGSLLSE
jgi:flagellar protein FliJ